MFATTSPLLSLIVIMQAIYHHTHLTRSRQHDIIYLTSHDHPEHQQQHISLVVIINTNNDTTHDNQTNPLVSAEHVISIHT
jgi:hypothetical protein